jgi:hypothetical protein
MGTIAQNDGATASTIAGNRTIARMGDELLPPCEVPAPFHESRYGRLILAAVWLASALFMWACLTRGWIPHDAGTLGQSAERVLEGQVPHRDFSEVYTGGLTYLNALAFRLFNVNLFSLRIPLFLFFLAWVPSIYGIARRFLAPVPAGAITLLAVAWSVPNYPEAMPSWYNLFFATWGTLTLIHYTETRERRWLWAAGVCGGLSFLVKVTGLYFVAAALLFLVSQGQSEAAPDGEGQGRADFTYSIFVVACLLAFLAVVAKLVVSRPSPASFFDFLLPAACLVAIAIRGEWKRAGCRGGFRRLFSVVLPFLGGLLLPIAIFLAFYTRAGALHAWFEGVFVLPMIRTQLAAFSAPSPLLMVGLAPLLAALSLAYSRRVGSPTAIGVVVTGGLAALLLAASVSAFVYKIVGLAMPTLVPLAAMAALLLLWQPGNLSERKRQLTFLLVAVASLCSLIQFPFSNPTYFCYVAPLVALAVAALISTTPSVNRAALGALVGFYLVFAVWLHAPGFFAALNRPPSRTVAFQTLALPRGNGIRVPAEQAREYEEIVGLVKSHAHGKYIYAGPDSPEIYFLSGYENPTRTLFAFLDPDFRQPGERTRRILDVIDRDRISLVVLRKDSEFSGPPPEQFRVTLDQRYPHSETVGKFEVRWK